MVNTYTDIFENFFTIFLRDMSRLQLSALVPAPTHTLTLVARTVRPSQP